MTKQIFCSVCSRPVSDGESRYYFPTLGAGHLLASFAGIAHVECLQLKDEELSIGRQLADIRESMARADASEKYARDGNVFLRGRLADEGKVEIYDGEDFCDFSLGNAEALRFAKGQLDEVVTPLISITSSDSGLKYTSTRPSFFLELKAMSAPRLRALLRRFFEVPGA